MDAPITGVHAITGTPLYLAPETITTPETIDARADLYALGAVAYWLVTGTHVFVVRSVVEVCGHCCYVLRRGLQKADVTEQVF